MFALAAFGCMTQNNTPGKLQTVPPDDITTPPATAPRPVIGSTTNSFSTIKLDTVVVCNDDPEAMRPGYCKEINEKRESAGRLYIAAAAHSLECKDSSITAACGIKLYSDGKLIFEDSKPTGTRWNTGCKDAEKRKVLCEIYVQGPAKTTKEYSANFVITDSYSGKSVEAIGETVRIVPGDGNVTLPQGEAETLIKYG